jgi:hypothetical protein
MIINCSNTSLQVTKKIAYYNLCVITNENLQIAKKAAEIAAKKKEYILEMRKCMPKIDEDMSQYLKKEVHEKERHKYVKDMRQYVQDMHEENMKKVNTIITKEEKTLDENLQSDYLYIIQLEEFDQDDEFHKTGIKLSRNLLEIAGEINTCLKAPDNQEEIEIKENHIKEKVQELSSVFKEVKANHSQHQKSLETMKKRQEQFRKLNNL